MSVLQLGLDLLCVCRVRIQGPQNSRFSKYDWLTDWLINWLIDKHINLASKRFIVKTKQMKAETDTCCNKWYKLKRKLQSSSSFVWINFLNCSVAKYFAVKFCYNCPSLVSKCMQLWSHICLPANWLVLLLSFSWSAVVSQLLAEFHCKNEIVLLH